MHQAKFHNLPLASSNINQPPDLNRSQTKVKIRQSDNELTNYVSVLKQGHQLLGTLGPFKV